MFLRGVLEVGHGGPEERANKQVARVEEGGPRWDANSVLRQASQARQGRATPIVTIGDREASRSAEERVKIQ